MTRNTFYFKTIIYIIENNEIEGRKSLEKITTRFLTWKRKEIEPYQNPQGNAWSPITFLPLKYIST